MAQTIRIGELTIAVTRKEVKHVHLSVHPPEGRVTLVVPPDTRLDVARAYTLSKLGWIRRYQLLFREQARESERKFVKRESHYVWGRRYLLDIVERNDPPSVSLDHRRITLFLRPGSDLSKREEIIHNWHKSLLHRAIPKLISSWEKKIGVLVAKYYIQKMKTKWGSCNPRRGTIRLNTELVKKPKDLLEYVLIHEMIHLLEPTHSSNFMKCLDRFCPTWREARAELNDLPLAAEKWRHLR